MILDVESAADALSADELQRRFWSHRRDDLCLILVMWSLARARAGADENVGNCL